MQYGEMNGTSWSGTILTDPKVYHGRTLGTDLTLDDYRDMGLWPIQYMESRIPRWKQRDGWITRVNRFTRTIVRMGNYVEKPLDDFKNERKAETAHTRWQHEVGGTTVDGMQVATDRDTQSKLIAARTVAKEDSTYTVKWKMPTGFTTLDAATIITVSDSVRAHVQMCFDNESALTDAIDAATTVQEIAAVDITTGWPV